MWYNRKLWNLGSVRHFNPLTAPFQMLEYLYFLLDATVLFKDSESESDIVVMFLK